MQSRQIFAVRCKRMSHFAKVCWASKEKVYVAERGRRKWVRVRGIIVLKIEEITAINGSGKQLTANITFLIDERYNEQLVHQLIGHWCYLQRYQSQKFSSAAAN